MRYLNLIVTDDLSEVYKTWRTNLISWDFPNFLANLDHFKEAPYLFSRYNLDSPFLTNFWSTLMTLGVSVGIFIGCFLLRIFFERSQGNKGWPYRILQKLVLGSFNFALVQVYGCLDDILFYLVLDFKGNPFNSFYAWISMICASGFMAAGGFLVYFNFRTVCSYQRAKAEKNMRTLEEFNERNKYWELFYADFNDADMWSQSTLALIVVRSGLSSLIIVVMYAYPLMQTLSLITLDGLMIFVLIKKDPFVTLRGKLAQYYFEIITLLVHLSAFILSLQDDESTFSETVLTGLCTSIIYLNTGLMIGSVGFMFIEIYKVISEKLKTKAQKAKKVETIATQTGLDDETQVLNIMTSVETQAQDQEKRTWIRNQQVAPIENSHFLSAFTEENSISFTGVNLLPSSNAFHLNMIAEDSVMSDAARAEEGNRHRGHSGVPMTIRHRRKNIQRKQTKGPGAL